MKIKFRIHFRWGDTIYYKDGKFIPFLTDDFLRCLLSFTEVKGFACEFKDRGWNVEADINPMTTDVFIRELKDTIHKFYGKNDAEVIVTFLKLGKREIGQYTVAYAMKEIKG